MSTATIATELVINEQSDFAKISVIHLGDRCWGTPGRLDPPGVRVPRMIGDVDMLAQFWRAELYRREHKLPRTHYLCGVCMKQPVLGVKRLIIALAVLGLVAVPTSAQAAEVHRVVIFDAPTEVELDDLTIVTATTWTQNSTGGVSEGPCPKQVTLQFKVRSATTWHVEDQFLTGLSGTCDPLERSYQLSWFPSGSGYLRVIVDGTPSTVQWVNAGEPTGDLEFMRWGVSTRTPIVDTPLTFNAKLKEFYTDGVLRPPSQRYGVKLQRRYTSGWVTLKTKLMDWNGYVEMTLAHPATGIYRMKAPGAATAPVKITTRPRVAHQVWANFPDTIYIGYRFTVTARMFDQLGDPWRKRETLTLQYKPKNSSSWKTLTSDWCQGSTVAILTATAPGVGYYRVMNLRTGYGYLTGYW